jgi:hypothetical protein
MKRHVRVQAACSVNDNADYEIVSQLGYLRWYAGVTLTIVAQDTFNHCAFVGQVQSKHSDAQARQGSRLFF